MDPNIEEIRKLMLELLITTRRETMQSFSAIDMDRVVHDDQAQWRLRDVLGHLAAWNGEAAKSLQAHSRGEEYHCIPSEAMYDEYNARLTAERWAWDIKLVWQEYEASGDQLKLQVESLSAENWGRMMLYPWNENGTVQYLIEVMMQHEIDHRIIAIPA